MYDTILVPTDGSEAARAAAREAFRIGEATGATVHVVSVVDEGAMNVLFSGSRLSTLIEEMTTEGREFVGDLAAMGEEAGVDVVSEVVRDVAVADAIADYAERHGVDLVVMSTHGRHGVDHVLGSTTERTLERAGIPVLVVPDPERE